MSLKNIVLTSVLILLIPIQAVCSSKNMLKKNQEIKALSDHLFFDSKTNTVILSGNVTIWSSDRTIKGDKVTIDRNKNTVDIIGNASVKTKTETLNGDTIFLDYAKKKGKIKKGKIFISEINFYITGEKIEKISEDTYIAENASLTSCDKPKNDWEIKADKLKATIEGYGYAKGVVLNTMDRPLFYTPFLFFPVKVKRQSGFLVPQIEYSQKYGFQANIPYYQVISDQADATFFYNFKEKRSDQKGIELRKRGINNYTEFYYDEINKDRYEYGKDYDSADKTMNRYWVRMKSDMNFDSGFKLNLDIDHASDPDYLYDFKSDYLGFDYTDKGFSKNFGRNLEPYDDTTRTNRLFLSKKTGPGMLESQLIWNDDLTAKLNNTNNSTVQTLPKISWAMPRSSTFNLPFQTGFKSEYDYFTRIYGERGHRLNLKPEIYIPFNISPYLSIEPSLSVDETFWYTSNKGEYDNEYNFRQIYNFDIKGSTSFYRVFNIYKGDLEKIKHTITPELSFSYIPDQDQTKLPEFDDFDRIERKKEFKFKLINTLTSKEINSTINKKKKDYKYREFLRFELSQIYDMTEFEKAHETENYTPEPFENMELYLKVEPIELISLQFDGKWSHYDNLFSERNTRLEAGKTDGSKFAVEHRYTVDENEYLNFNFSLFMSDRFKLHGLYETTLMDNGTESNNYEKEIGLEYISQCWKSDISYNETENDKKVTVSFELKGLGGIYQSLSE